ncbi:Protein of unknown function DUF3383 [uncultured Caudovirales phage]|uniref:Uncharacterized protein n=1 Tax=uncultured Caudovirales phage TaxID=2100421 RepID=A0A6J5N0S5_9CAUD|nr:Protein of unknown function DUF3383 [uncultured Caudovirales phage]
MALPVSRLVRVVVNLSPLAAARRSFGILMVAGDSDVISGLERVRSYDTLEGVAEDFGTSAPEYFAAAAYFGQSPKPKTIMIGRWLRIATVGFNKGGILSSAEQLLSNFTVITTGTLTIPIDGVSRSVTGLDFSAQTNLNGVASVLQTALASWATVVWDGEAFVVKSITTGISSAVGYSTAGTVQTLLKLTSGTSQGLTPGYAAETPVECAAALVNISSAWYGLMFQASVQPTDDQSIAVSTFIEALDIKRIYGVTIINTNVLSSSVSDDLASRQKDGGYKRSFCQFSSTSAYAIASFFGRAFSVNFNANRSVITLMYKQEPGIVGEELTTTQANVLKDKRCNVFVKYVNDTVIIQYGVMSGPAWFDEIHGLDWFQDAIQNACYNLLYQSSTKIPQTDAGANQFVNAIGGVCDEAVNNGLVAPGTWNADGFGELAYGQYLKTGYYIYAQPMALQSQAERETRVAPPIQTAVKLAGAIQELDVIVDVNR